MSSSLSMKAVVFLACRFKVRDIGGFLKLAWLNPPFEVTDAACGCGVGNCGSTNLLVFLAAIFYVLKGLFAPPPPIAAGFILAASSAIESLGGLSSFCRYGIGLACTCFYSSCCFTTGGFATS